MSLVENVGRLAGRARYTVEQGARVAWYSAHYLAARRMSQPFDRPGEPKFRPVAPAGDVRRIRQSFIDLFAADRANIDAGLYPAPRDFSPGKAMRAFDRSQRFFKDVPRVDARRLERRGAEVRSNAEQGRYPAYYLQNFHYQSGGWLTPESAALYDTQVEVLFAGAADAMRRIALGSLARGLRGKDQRRVRHLDIACGTGRFLAQTLHAFPRMPSTGLDLSPAYIDAARAQIARWPQAEAVVGNAEALPFADASLDAITCIYLFHELPPRVRRDVAREIARVLKPGGVFIFGDSLQAGDAPDLDQMLEYFPVGFHEPFYGSYQEEDLVALFGDTGLKVQETELAFLTKVMRFTRF
ncbi:MAG: class I SAM-dependent methyltransferase [Hyphomonadaceae bacterium]|nr:class I SAM-dependent methyltransferase [Hyphomonadaceae bacterium]